MGYWVFDSSSFVRSRKRWKATTSFKFPIESISQVVYSVFPTLSETVGCFIVNHNQKTPPKNQKPVQPRTLATMLRSTIRQDPHSTWNGCYFCLRQLWSGIHQFTPRSVGKTLLSFQASKAILCTYWVRSTKFYAPLADLSRVWVALKDILKPPILNLKQLGKVGRQEHPFEIVYLEKNKCIQINLSYYLAHKFPVVEC